MVKVSTNNINNNNRGCGKNRIMESPQTITLSKEKRSIATSAESLSASNSEIEAKRVSPDGVTRKLARHTKKKQAISKLPRLKTTAASPPKIQKPAQPNAFITASSAPQHTIHQSPLTIHPNMITTTLIRQPTSVTATPSLQAPMPAQILSSLLLRGCNKPSGVTTGKLQTPFSITLPTEPLPRSAASQHKISNDLKLRQCPAIVAVAPATPRTVLVSPSGIPTVTMVQANTPPVSPMTLVTVPNRTSLPQKIALPQVPVPQSELAVQRKPLHISLRGGSTTIVRPSLPTPPSSSVSMCESTMSCGGSLEDSSTSSTSSANNSINLSPVDDLNNPSSNTLLDFDVFENSIDCMVDIKQEESSINGDMKDDIGLEDNNSILMDDSIMSKDDEPILNIKEESIGALLDQSEDPCLNEGQNGTHFHQVQNLAGLQVQLNNNNGYLSNSCALNSSSLNSTYLKCLSHIDMGNNGAITSSPFASDSIELDNVHRWLELCDTPGNTTTG